MDFFASLCTVESCKNVWFQKNHAYQLPSLRYTKERITEAIAASKAIFLITGARQYLQPLALPGLGFSNLLDWPSVNGLVALLFRFDLITAENLRGPAIRAASLL